MISSSFVPISSTYRYLVVQALWAHFDLTGSGAQQQEGACGVYLHVHAHDRSYRNAYWLERAQPLDRIESNHHHFLPPTTTTTTERCLCVLRDPELLCIYPPDGQVSMCCTCRFLSLFPGWLFRLCLPTNIKKGGGRSRFLSLRLKKNRTLTGVRGGPPLPRPAALGPGEARGRGPAHPAAAGAFLFGQHVRADWRGRVGLVGEILTFVHTFALSPHPRVIGRVGGRAAHGRGADAARAAGG